MERNTKIQLVNDLRDALVSSPSVVLADFRGMSVEQSGQLRRACDEAGVHFRVVKNRLIEKATEGSDHAVIAPLLNGMTAIAWGEDAVAPAKVLAKFMKANECLTFKGGALQGNLLDPAGVLSLSELASLPEMRSQLLGLFNAPAAKLLAHFNAPAQKLVGTVQAWADDRDAA